VDIRKHPINDEDLHQLLISRNSMDKIELLHILNNYINKFKRGKISATIFTSDEDPSSTLLNLSDSFHEVKIHKFDNFSEIFIHVINKSDDEENEIIEYETGYSYIIKLCEGIWAILSIEEDDHIEFVHNFIKYGSPDISRLNFTSNDIKKIIGAILNNEGYDAIIKKAVTYPYGGKGAINFEPMDFYQVFEKCNDENRFLDKARISIIKNDEEIIDFFVSRVGIIRFYSGNIDYFFNLFVNAFAESAKHTKRILENRERKFGETSVKPIVINFNSDVFIKLNNNSQFINSLSTLDKTGISVYHSNPYLHVSIVDFQDGSSYDVFAISSKSVCIVPSFRSSINSLMKISDHIFKSVGEGEIDVWHEKELTLSDYFE